LEEETLAKETAAQFGSVEGYKAVFRNYVC
jgi:hypothetical protein